MFNMRFTTNLRHLYQIIESFFQEPEKNVIWLKGLVLYIFTRGKWRPIGGGAYIEVTETELRELVEKKQLTPNMTYVIRNWTTLVNGNKITRYYSDSAKHKYDVFLTALSESTLDSKVRLTKPSDVNDTYFADNNTDPEKWYAEFDLYGDKYKWAAKNSAQITRLIDEFGNDCPYDFKNILYKSTPDSDVKYYTFTKRVIQGNEAVLKDASLSSSGIKVVENKVGGKTVESFKYDLPEIIFINECHYNKIFQQSYDVMLTESNYVFISDSNDIGVHQSKCIQIKEECGGIDLTDCSYVRILEHCKNLDLSSLENVEIRCKVGYDTTTVIPDSKAMYFQDIEHNYEVDSYTIDTEIVTDITVDIQTGQQYTIGITMNKQDFEVLYKKWFNTTYKQEQFDIIKRV